MQTLRGGSGAHTLPPPPGSESAGIGNIVDSRYRITGKLGSGGMGCVYLAEHVSIRRPVALKLLHPEACEVDEYAKRFEREAFAIGRIDHPNCVKVSDFGKIDDGTWYMVLELLDGVLLFDLLDKERRIEWKRALHIARHILSALAHVHERGIIHRDIKPENIILVDQDGDPDFAKIVDFGIAKLKDEAQPDEDTGLLTHDNKLTQRGITIGTPTYIPPEQAYGRPIDGRADLYSLSVMLYEMIAGVPPFDADDVGALLRMHISSKVPPFAEMAPGLEVPTAVEQLIRHGLAKRAPDRIGSAQEYIEQIDAILPAREPRKLVLPNVQSLVVDRIRGTVAPAMARTVPKKSALRWVAATALTVVALFALGAFALSGNEPESLPRAPASELEQPGLSVLAFGHARVAEHRSILALAAYEKAVLRDPLLAHDETMRDNVEAMLGNDVPAVIDAVLDFLGFLVSETDDSSAAEQLVDLASSTKMSYRRHKALSVAQNVGLGDRVDLLSSYLLDLRLGETCKIRKEGVAKLRALGDKRAIPALRAARTRTRTEGGVVKRKVNTNACLRADANRAIRYLESL